MAAPVPKAGAVLGLDIGTHLGWALAVNDTIRRSGSIDLSLRAADVPGRRYLRLARWLEREFAPPFDPDPLVVVLEDVRSHEIRDKATGRRSFGTTAAHVYGGLRAIIEAWAAAKGVAVIPVGVGSWKSGIGLPGAHAPKEAVMARVKLLGYRPGSQDEADAIGVALHGWRAARRAAL